MGGRPTGRLKHDNSNDLDLENMLFTQATYSSARGLDCKYLVFWVQPSPIFPSSVHLVKQGQYTEIDFIDHTGWQKDPKTGTYKCVNDHVEACAFNSR